MCELIATGTGQNSYVTLEEAEAYFATRLDASLWTASSDDDRFKALATAFKALERIDMWRGRAYTTLQATRWPRRDVVRTTVSDLPDDLIYWGESIPPDLKDAQCEEALTRLELAADPGALSRRRRQRQGVKGASVTGLSESWGDVPRYAQGCLVSPEAYALIRKYLALGGTIQVDAGSGRV
jgi:hypothetical protein